MSQIHNQNDLLMSFGEDIFNFEEQVKQKVIDFNLYEDQNFLNEQNEKNSYDKNLSIFDEISPIESGRTGMKIFSKSPIKLQERNFEFSSLVNIGNKNNASFVNLENKSADGVTNNSYLGINREKKDIFYNSSNKNFKIKSSFLKPSVKEITNNTNQKNFKSNINNKTNTIEKRLNKEKAKIKTANLESRKENERLSIQSKSNTEIYIPKKTIKGDKKMRNKNPSIFNSNDGSINPQINGKLNAEETEQNKINKMEYLQNIRRIKEMNVAKFFQKNKQERKQIITKNKKIKEKFKIISSEIELSKNLEESSNIYKNNIAKEKNCNNIQKSKFNDYSQKYYLLKFNSSSIKKFKI